MGTNHHIINLNRFTKYVAVQKLTEKNGNFLYTLFLSMKRIHILSISLKLQIELKSVKQMSLLSMHTLVF